MAVAAYRLAFIAAASALTLAACSPKDEAADATGAASGQAAANPNAPVTATPRQTRSVAVDVQGVTEVGATVRVKNVDLAEDATVLDVSISFASKMTNNVEMASNPTYIALPNGQKLMLKAPEGNPNMNIVNGDTMNGRLVFMGAVPRDAQSISVVFNEGSSSDSIIGPFLRLDVPLQAARAAG
ncbi:hypothetical protein ABOZ73_08285 [Caulobacter sp. 73W]|uniref:DUF4352 domain-containing protein n=1 Tax=Caulobacter sp. 73W TaxID=3161137 RepID=A0AB39KXD4_9CAUL